MSDDLQFDRVVTAATPAALTAADRPAVTCRGCQSPITTEYFQVNDSVFCARCRTAVEAAAETPRGVAPFAIAALFGLGAGLVGAIVYYAVIALANLEIGLVAVLIGYMVGYAVRKGAGGRGGRRFQILAVALTYASVALAYTPIVVKQIIDDIDAKKTSAVSPAATAEAATPSAPPQMGLGSLALGLGMIALGALSLPILVIVGSLPSGLLSAIIIFVGMRQAWRMTAAPAFVVYGPYRVGSEPAVATT